MKKIKSLFLLSLFLVACQENAVTKKESDYSSIIKNLEDTYNGTFSIALNSQLGDVYTNTYDYLKKNYYTGSFQINANDIKSRTSAITRISSASELDLSFLTADQKKLTIPFLDNILQQDDPSTANLLVENYYKDVISSSLADEQKYQLLTIGSAIKVSVKFINDSILKSSRVSAARIDVKSALQAGVIGLASGAIGGCYTGATGGTVAFPGLGTATGCVGGAVLGGAVGFIGGVTSSIIQNLIFG